MYFLEKAPESFQKDYFDVVASIIKSKYVGIPNDAVGNNFFTQVQKSIDAGRIPIIVSHSEGNFYANYITRKLQKHYQAPTKDNPARFFGNIQIASPAWFNGSVYGASILRGDDIVIAKLAEELGGSSEVTHKSGVKTEFTHHEFIKSYLEDPQIRKQFIASVASTFFDLRTKGFYEDYGKIDAIKQGDDNPGCEISYLLHYQGEDEDCVGDGTATCHCMPEGKYSVDVSLYNTSKKQCGFNLQFQTPQSTSLMPFEILKSDGVITRSEDYQGEVSLSYRDKGLFFVSRITKTKK
ncbi:MAG TPA: hypothetical protein VI754_06990 [Bacteriovoracaceae bacterium]|nr:hypothetical protein [Bacteriovoracaceae bacterium]